MRRIVFLLGIFLTVIGVSAQQTVTVQAQSYQVSDNLDLEAVAITFGESKNIEDFERRLNDPDNRISNLDLNNDGYVDFLRVVEVNENGTHLIVIQAVIGQDLYQDVASIIVEGKNKTSATITIVGNRDIYGDNYVIVPRYVVRPAIFDWFWLPTYAVYRSIWYWDYYPHYYHRHLCLGYHSYHRHIHVWHTHHHHRCEFHRPTKYHHHNHHVEMYRGVSRNDYATHRPNHGYRSTPTPNRHIEARPTREASKTADGSRTQGRNPGSMSTSTNKIDRTTSRRQSSTQTVQEIQRSSTARTVNPSATVRSTSTTRKTTSTAVRPNTSTVNRSTSVTARPATTVKRSTSVTSSASTTRKTTSTAVRPNTSTVNRSTSVTARPKTTTKSSTAVRPSTSSTRNSTVTTVRSSSSTNRNASTSARSTSTIKTNNNIQRVRR